MVKTTTDLRGPRLAAIASAGGLLEGVLYASLPWPRLWLRFLTPAPLVFALLFLLVSPTSALVLPARAASAPGPTTVAAATGDRPPVVMILFDEFPLSSLLDAEGRIDRRVYPNFAALADESTWYRNATGVAGYTPWAMPAMLTGNYPAEARAPSWTAYPDNLFTLLDGSYDLKVYETISQLCPPSQYLSSAGNLDQSGLRAVVGDSARVLKELLQPHDAAFDPAFFVDQTQPRQQQALRSEQAAAAQFRCADRVQSAGALQRLPGRPEGHGPVDPALPAPAAASPALALPAVGRRAELQRPSGAPSRATGCRPTLLALARSSTCCRWPYTDWLVGQVVDKLKAEGLWDKSLVVMGADHGEAGPPASTTAPSGGATPPTSCGCRSSSRPRTRTTRSLTTTIGSRSTCCRPSPPPRHPDCRGP